MDTLGSRIAGLMEQYGYTQKELAAEVGVTEAAMSRYINNSRMPRGTVIAEIAYKLNTSTDYLLGVRSIAEKKEDDLYEELISLLNDAVRAKYVQRFTSGYEVGKNDGYVQGRDAGLKAGGFADGYKAGYEQRKREG
jgi:transcriptional regulator with XRE-family HTH domain